MEITVDGLSDNGYKIEDGGDFVKYNIYSNRRTLIVREDDHHPNCWHVLLRPDTGSRLSYLGIFETMEQLEGLNKALLEDYNY